jgi:hypothetical protein
LADHRQPRVLAAMSTIHSLTLAIDYAITEDDPKTGLPWPPPELDNWEFVCRRPAERTTVWRRIALTPERP